MSNLFNKLFKSNQAPIVSDYENWRNIIFSIKSENVGVLSTELNQVFGVVMDVGAIKDGKSTNDYLIVSQTAFPTGESSFKLSNGGGIIGLGGDKEISEVAKQIIPAAQSLLEMTKPVTNHTLPISGQVYFYLLTTSGIRLYECKLNDFRTSPNQPFAQIFSRFAWIKRRGDEIQNQPQPKQAQ